MRYLEEIINKNMQMIGWVWGKSNTTKFRELGKSYHENKLNCTFTRVIKIYQLWEKMRSLVEKDFDFKDLLIGNSSKIY